MKKSIIALSLLLSAAYSHAQTLQFSDVSLFGNSGNTTASPLSSSDINYLKSNLSIPAQAGFNVKSGHNRYSNAIGIMAGWNIRQKKDAHNKLLHKLRTSVSFGNYGLNLDAYSNNRTVTTIDTFVSQNTGDKLYVDSVFYQSKSLSHNATMFNGDVSYIISMNRQRKLSLYTGVGFGFGISLQNYMEANNFETSYIQNNYANYYGNKNYESKHESESRKLSTTSNFRAYIPLGVSYRLSNRSPFLRQISIFGEMNLGLEANRMQGISSNIGFYNSANLGVKVSFLDMKANKNRPNRGPRERVREGKERHKRY